jgi:rod shape-determining protein MreD
VRWARLPAFVLGGLALAVLIDSFALALTGPDRLFDPYLVLVVLVAARGDRKASALAVGAVVGLAQDGLGSSVFGIHYVAKVVVAYGVARASDVLIPGQPLTWAVLLAGGTLAELFVYRAMGFLLGQSFDARTLAPLVALFLLNVALGTLACVAGRRLSGKWAIGGGHALGARR